MMEIEELPMRHRWRVLLAIDLGMFNVALFFFAYLPPDSIIRQEWAAMWLSVFAAIGVVSHAIPRIRLPGERWAYLVTCCVGLYVMIAYAHLYQGPVEEKVPLILFLVSGIASSYAAHVIDGGRRATPDGNG